MDSDEQVLLFLKMKECELDEFLRNQIRNAIKKLLSPRHVPGHILQVQDIPYTMNGKKMENIVRNVVCGGTVKNLSTVANPECLEEYRKFTELPVVGRCAKL